jgi:hypothetical protein
LSNFDDTSIKVDGADDFTWLTGELYGALQIGPFTESYGFEVYTGLRYVRHDEDVTRNEGSEAITRNVKETWVEPVLGGRIFTELGKRWWAQFHSDIGGFGVGTDFTWTLGGELGFRIAKPIDITMRYDYQEIEYSNEKAGADRYIWSNGVQQGWYFGLALKL